MKLTEKQEIWRPVKNYEGLYEVSNFRRVRSCDRVILKSNGIVQSRNSRIRKQVPTRTGYLQVNLSKNNIQKMVKFISWWHKHSYLILKGIQR